jgi:hypothetical protein
MVKIQNMWNAKAKVQSEAYHDHFKTLQNTSLVNNRSTNSHSGNSGCFNEDTDKGLH